MKKLLFLSLAFLSIVLMSFATIKPIKDVFIVNATQSKVNWKGYKPVGSHAGTLQLQSGSLELNDGQIIGGTFTANMTSIVDENNSSKLESHLKSADFFDIVAFPTASFTINSVSEKDGKFIISGAMTIKGITKTIYFPAAIKQEGNSVTLTTDTFQINRSDFKITYKSKSFFNNLKDKFIEDNFDLQVTIVASK